MRAPAAFALAALVLAALVLAALAIGPGAAGVAPAGAAGQSSHTALTVTYWEDEAQSANRDVWTLRCDPARGTHPRPQLACRRLDAGGPKLFAPIRKDVACTEIYGGPQTALIVGVVDGKRVWARLSRENGCQIARWSRVSPWLLPPGGAK